MRSAQSAIITTTTTTIATTVVVVVVVAVFVTLSVSITTVSHLFGKISQKSRYVIFCRFVDRFFRNTTVFGSIASFTYSYTFLSFFRNPVYVGDRGYICK